MAETNIEFVEKANKHIEQLVEKEYDFLQELKQSYRLLLDACTRLEELQASHDRLEQQVMERLRPCLHCQHTGWIHTDDDIPDQMCPYCFVGKVVLECYRKTTEIQLGDYHKLKAKADSHDDLLAACVKTQNWLDTSSLQEYLVHGGENKVRDALIMGLANCLIRLEAVIAKHKGKQDG